jgi:hypothetical protein
MEEAFIQSLAGRPEGTILLGRSIHGLYDAKMDIRETG